MNEQKKNLLHLIADWWEQRRSYQPHVTRASRWLPTPGNIIFTLLVAAFLVLTQRAWATPQAATSAINATINYQGRLADTGGVPIDGNVAMSFAIFDAPSGGNLLWGPETHASVPAADGLFNVGLGSLTGGGIPATVWQGGDRYLQITVAGETLAPREIIRSVPSARVAEYALTADIALTVPDGALASRHVNLSTQQGTGSGQTTLTDTFQTIPGTTLTVSPQTNQTYIIFTTVDISTNSAGAIAQIFVDGVSVGNPAVVQNVSGRTTGATVYLVDLDAGTHTIELRARQYAGTGTAIVRGTGTTISYIAVSQ
jgi:hypothetical protein